MKIQLVLISQLGEFIGAPFEVTLEQYEEIKKKSSDYYDQGGFEMVDEFGNWVIISPNIISNSILKIKIVRKDVQE
jgi:hypothetical protein